MITLRTASVDETRDVAAALASLARPGDLIVLAGEMGAGKTAFAQGFAAGLGVLDPVTSPTFTLVHAYEGRLRVYHVDLYRLERMAELADLALGELLDDDDAVVLVEWGDVVSAALGADLMTVRLEWVGPDEPGGEDARLVSITASGDGWTSRWPKVQSALAAWVAS